MGQNIVKKQQVLVIEGNTLFINGVKLLLVLQEKLEIVGTVPTDIRAIATKIDQTQARVIIINDEATNGNSGLILPLLKSYPDLRVITLNLENNRINIYNSHEVMINTSQDLVAAITNRGI